MVAIGIVPVNIVVDVLVMADVIVTVVLFKKRPLVCCCRCYYGHYNDNNKQGAIC